MNQLVQAKLKTIDTTKGFNLDGYPATKDQAGFWPASCNRRNIQRR
jgi:adenylate kinase family enzyme